MESRLEKIFSMGINIMSLAVWLGEDRKCSPVLFSWISYVMHDHARPNNLFVPNLLIISENAKT